MADLPPGTPDAPDPSPQRDATAQPERRRSSLLSRPSTTAQPTNSPSDPPLAPRHSELTTADVTASSITFTSTASPFGTSASLARTAPYSAAGPSSLSRLARFPHPRADESFRHPHLVPGYGRQSLGSPGGGRRASAAASALGYDRDGGEEEDTGSFGRYRAGRKSEVYNEVGNVSVGVSEGYFGGSRSVRTSPAVSQRSSFGRVVGGLNDEEEDGADDDDDGDADQPKMERSLSRISSAADEEVYAFNKFRLSDESDATDQGSGQEDDEDEDGGDDFGDEEGARALSDPAGIDWDDVLRDAGRGGGDEEGEERVSSVGSMERGKGRQAQYEEEEDDQPRYDYYGQDSEDDVVREDEIIHDSFEHAPLSARLPKAPPLAKAAAARKKRALPKKANR